MAPNPKILMVVGLNSLWLGEVLHIVSLATPGWMVAANGDSLGYGLFKFCDNHECHELYDPPSEWKATEAMAILGTLCGLLGCLVAVYTYVSTFILGNLVPKISVFVCPTACAAACMFIVISLFVFGLKIYGPIEPSMDPGYSFALSVVAAVLIPIGGVVLTAGARQVVQEDMGALMSQ